MDERVIVREESPYGYGRASWEINLGCNYACSHCYLGLKEFAGLPWPEKARLLHMMRDAGVVWLQITGGEPTIDKHFTDAYRLAFELGMTMVRTALYSLPRQASSLVRSELLGLESRAYAQLGANETGNADRSAQTCVAVYEEAPQHEPAPDWIHYMNQAEVDCLAANTYIELALRADDRPQWQHYATKAEVHSLRARQNRGEGYVRSRVFDEIRLAKVRLAQREPAESAAVGTHAVHLAAETRSSLIVNWLTRFSRDLAGRHPDVPEVSRFREQVRDYVRKAAPARLEEL